MREVESKDMTPFPSGVFGTGNGNGNGLGLGTDEARELDLAANADRLLLRQSSRLYLRALRPSGSTTHDGRILRVFVRTGFDRTRRRSPLAHAPTDRLQCPTEVRPPDACTQSQ